MCAFLFLFFLKTNQMMKTSVQTNGVSGQMGEKKRTIINTLCYSQCVKMTHRFVSGFKSLISSLFLFISMFSDI